MRRKKWESNGPGLLPTDRGPDGPGPLPTDRGPDSAGARADDPLRLPSLTLCSDSEVALRLACPYWASFSTVKHGHLRLPTRDCSG
jgi:hypothetical protein